MFSKETQKKIREAIQHYPPDRKEAAMLPVLHLVQAELGYLPLEAMEEVAQILDVSPVRVYSTATFYTMFHLEPVGKYHIQVCRTLSCWLRGSERISRCLEKKLGIKTGETTPDGLFTLDTAECLASCNTAPVMQINERYHENLTEEEASRILDDLARKARKRQQVG